MPNDVAKYFAIIPALAPSNNALRTRIAGDIAALEKSQNGKPVKNIPADMVTTSASGLDPHISLDNAEFQLSRVADTWAKKLKRNPADVRTEIEGMLKKILMLLCGGWQEKSLSMCWS